MAAGLRRIRRASVAEANRFQRQPHRGLLFGHDGRSAHPYRGSPEHCFDNGSSGADLDAGREDAWTACPFVNSRLRYIPNEPLRWLGMQAGLGWYRLAES
jgi:hypothetical protein